ncbi:P-loop containing nucleoside triphosphate hydrolase protein [Spinellus fusiger]|nr:P-loop containing nucleoside triphosphate hydrolase protein [Spinellus fusiger]
MSCGQCHNSRSENVLKGLYEMNYSAPSKIQERALPLLMADPPRNMIGQSQSGTGKTAAFVLTMLHRITEDQKCPQAICLAPSRELARQIVDVIQTMAKFTSVSVSMVIKESLAKKRPINEHIVVGTPGSVQDVIRRGLLDTKHIKIFVLDEADNMLDQNGLGDQSIRINKMIQSTPQIVLFSATYAEHVGVFAHRFAPNADELSLKRSELSVDGIMQFYMDCSDEEQKYDVLCNLYDLLTVSQSIIFCRRRESADEIARRMTETGHAVVSLHGAMSPEERDMVMDGFRRGEFKVLITTNVLARGIDILQVTLVINYDMPQTYGGGVDAEAYLHRVGRTGRFGRKGVSINFVHDRKSWEEMHAMEVYFGRTICRLGTDDWEEVDKTLKSVTVMEEPVTDGEEEEEEEEAETAQGRCLLDDHAEDAEDIDVIHMRVADIPALGLERFQHLERLCLRQNFIVRIKGLESLEHLKELDLYDNKISHIKGLESLQTLELLDLSFNKIKSIKHLETLLHLKDLFFVSNKISKIENLEALVNVTNLELGANRIRTIENLDTLVHLEKLWLGKNKITRLENLSPLRNLRLLSIQSNRLTKLEGLDSLVHLEELYTSHNAIERIEGLEHNTKLTTLDVANNKITHIENLSHLKHLEEFWANNNQLGNECFEELKQQLGSCTSMQTVYLEGNPMQLNNSATYLNKVRLAIPHLQQIDAT